MSKTNHVFRRDEILRAVWGTEIIVGDRTIDVHIRKLRSKLGGNYISTIKGSRLQIQQLKFSLKKHCLKAVF